MDIIKCAVVILLVAHSAAFAEPTSQGRIELLSVCPGDHAGPDPDVNKLKPLEAVPELKPEAAVISAILAPIAAAVAKKGLNAAAERLRETAAEQSVETIHLGDAPLYVAQVGSPAERGLVDFGTAKIVPASRCLLVVSKGTYLPKEKPDSPDFLVRVTTGYKSLKEYKAGNEVREQLSKDASFEKKPEALQEKIKEYIVGNQVPGLVAVIDIVPSPTMDSFRFEPRFVATDHSIREKRRDTKERDFTIGLKMTSPAAVGPIEALLKFESMVQGTPYIREEGKPKLSPSGWKTFLPLTEAEKSKRALFESLVNDLIAARTNYVAAQEHSNDAPKGIATIDSKDNNCVAIKELVDASILKKRATSQLEAIAKKRKDHERGTKVDDRGSRWLEEHDRLDAYEAYWSSCFKFYQTQEKLQKEPFSRTIKDESGNDTKRLDFAIGVSDVYVDIKEFRERRLAKFMGDILTDADVQSSMAKAASDVVVGDTTEQSTLDASYEAALVAAETAIAVFNTTPTDVARIDMNSKKRAANRIANDQGRSLPYPDAGLWGF